MGILQIGGPIFDVQGVHLEGRGIHQMTRADEAIERSMVANHVAHVLAQEALDALPEFLHPLDVRLDNPPRPVWCIGRAAA